MARKREPLVLQRHPNHRKMIVNRYVGQKLRESRNMAGLSLKAASDLIGITAQQFNRYENGYNSPNVEILIRWGKVCGRSPNFFLADVPLTEEDLVEVQRPPVSPAIMKDAYWIAEMLARIPSDSRSRLRWFLRDYEKIVRQASRWKEKHGDDEAE